VQNNLKFKLFSHFLTK